MAGSATRKAAAIWAVVRPQTARRVRAICDSRGSAGWQQAKTMPSSSSSSVSVPSATLSMVAASSASFSGPAQPVDGLAAGGGGQPAAAVGRDLAVPPVLDGLDEGVLNGVFGQAHVAEPRG